MYLLNHYLTSPQFDRSALDFAVREEIEAQNAVWMELFKSRDFRALADTCYTVDCSVITANNPLASGRDG